MFLLVAQRGADVGALRHMLDRHTDAYTADTGRLVIPLAFLLERVSDAEAARRLTAGLFAAAADLGLTKAELEAALADAEPTLAGVLSAVHDAAAAHVGAAQGGTSTGLGVPVLHRGGLFGGDVALVHLVRDVRAVVADAAQNPDDDRTAVEIARQWNLGNRNFQDRRRREGTPFLQVRQEDLIEHPDTTLRAVADHIGVTVNGPVTAPPGASGAHGARALAADTRRDVTFAARDGLFDFGYDPPPRSPRRAARRLAVRAEAGRDRVVHAVAAVRERAWSLRPKPPWAARKSAEELAAAWCLVCRWTGEAFTGQQHAESADCPRCGSIARERFLLRCLTHEGAPAGRLDVLEIAPRQAGSINRAMRRWFHHDVLEPVPAGSASSRPLGSLAGLADLPDTAHDAVLSAHDLQAVPDADAVLAEWHRVLRPGGRLVLQVPLLQAVTEALDVGDAVPPGTARHTFGLDLTDRVAAAGFDVALLVPDDVQEVVSGQAAASTLLASGEVDAAGLVGAAAEQRVIGVADHRLARQSGWRPAILFWTIVGERR